MWWLLLFSCWTSAPTDDPIEVIVVRGDTLFLIAQAHGVTLDALRAENAIEGDLIEVGQRLLIPSGATAPPKPTPSRKKTSRPKPVPQPGLTRPTPKPCLPPPDGSDLADEGMTASKGLSASAVRAAMAEHLPKTLSCAQSEATWPTGSVQAKLTVSCDGTVSSVRVLSSTGLQADTVGCVRDVLTYAGFPAHDLPDGYTFTQPVNFSP